MTLEKGFAYLMTRPHMYMQLTRSIKCPKSCFFLLKYSLVRVANQSITIMLLLVFSVISSFFYKPQNGTSICHLFNWFIFHRFFHKTTKGTGATMLYYKVINKPLPNYLGLKNSVHLFILISHRFMLCGYVKKDSLVSYFCFFS